MMNANSHFGTLRYSLINVYSLGYLCRLFDANIVTRVNLS